VCCFIIYECDIKVCVVCIIITGGGASYLQRGGIH
jgi:hypothetical protein